MENRKLSKNFWLSEIVHSNTASRLKIDNTPSPAIEKNIEEAVVKLHQKARNLLGKPMLVESGFRCYALNKKVGGDNNSGHLFGYAIDFTAPDFGTPRQIVDFLAKEFERLGIKYDELICEFPNSPNGGWVHLSYKSYAGTQRMKLKTIT